MGVNQWITNWHWTGTNVQTPQAKVDLRFDWIDSNGDLQTWSGEATFPNDLQLVPVAWVKEALEELITRAARKRLGIDG